MFKKIINIYNNFEEKTYIILRKGLEFCFLLSISSVFLLLTYDFFIPSPFLYNIGLSMFRLSLIFAIEFVVCSFVVDGIKKQLV